MLLACSRYHASREYRNVRSIAMLRHAVCEGCACPPTFISHVPLVTFSRPPHPHRRVSHQQWRLQIGEPNGKRDRE